MQNIVICEDDSKQALYLKDLVLSKIPECNIFIYNSGKTLIENIENFDEFTIFFMDIILVDQNGIELSKIINKSVKNAIIIFISAYLDKVTDIFETNHCYFVYKPELEIRLQPAINKALLTIYEEKQNLTIQLKNKIVVIALKDILYLERIKRTTFIYCFNEVYRCSYNLDYFLDTLPPLFVLCHRSFIVNLNNVKEFLRTNFILQNNTIIPVSRSHYQDVKEQFQNFLFKNI